MTDSELAFGLAEKFHDGQKYGDMPYIRHIIEVHSEVYINFPGDERLLIVANLHDILEDTAATPEVIESLFGDDIKDAVVAITHTRGESRLAYLRRVKANPLAHKVKLCDSFVNLRNSLKRGDMKRVQKYGGYIGFLAAVQEDD